MGVAGVEEGKAGGDCPLDIGKSFVVGGGIWWTALLLSGRVRVQGPYYFRNPDFDEAELGLNWTEFLFR